MTPDGFHIVWDAEDTAWALMHALSAEDSVRAILQPGELLDYKSCISEYSMSSEGASITLPWETYKHTPFYEKEEMLLDISFVKEYDALRAYPNSGALGHT